MRKRFDRKDGKDMHLERIKQEARLDMDENMGNLNDRVTRQARATFHRPAFQGTILEPRGQQDNDSAITEDGTSE